jgi:hypothetical protein
LNQPRVIADEVMDDNDDEMPFEQDKKGFGKSKSTVDQA